MDRAPDERSRPIELSGKIVTAVATIIGFGLAVASVALRPAEAVQPPDFSGQALAAAERLAHSPADRASLETLARLSLDLGGDRRELWRNATAAAQRLAPALDSPKLAFVRGGLLHWYEIDERDRQEVAATAAFLLRDEAHYRVLWQPILQTMRDPGFLAEHVPADPAIRRQLRDTAALWGDHATYRALEREIPIEWRAERKIETFNRSRKGTIPPTKAWQLDIGSAETVLIDASAEELLQPPVMVEVRIDGSLREGRLLSEERSWTVGIHPSDQVIELRVANPRTTSGTARKVHVTLTPDGTSP